MTKETIFQQIRNLILPEFENETTKFKSLAISPYHPVIVVEFEKKLKNSEFYQNSYPDCCITKCGKFIWCTEFMHY